MSYIKMKSPTQGGSVTLESEDIATDETITIKKSEFDKLASIDVRGLATAWGTFNGDGTARSSFNTSASLDSVGIYTITFDTPMDNIDYTLSGTSQDPAVVTILTQLPDLNTLTTTQVQVRRSDTSVVTTPESFRVVFHGGKN